MLVTSCHHQDGFNEYICWLRLIAKVDFSRLFLPFRNHISGPHFGHSNVFFAILLILNVLGCVNRVFGFKNHIFYAERH